MNKKLSLLLATATILTSSLPTHAWFKETALATFNTIKNHPGILCCVGLAATAACLYKKGQYQKKSDKSAALITHLNDQEKALINDAIATPLRDHKRINVAERLYEKIDSNHMSRLSKAVLQLMVEEYNVALKEKMRLDAIEPGNVYAEFQQAEADLKKYVALLNDHQAAVDHVQKLEQYRDRYRILSYICGAASLVPLALFIKKSY